MYKQLNRLSTAIGSSDVCYPSRLWTDMSQHVGVTIVENQDLSLLVELPTSALPVIVLMSSLSGIRRSDQRAS